MTDLDCLIFEGADYNVSDIHLSLDDTACAIHFRIQGDYRHIRTLPLEQGLALIRIAKFKGNLDICAYRVPQDGRLSCIFRNETIDVRIAIIPTIHGEDLVLRLFDSQSPYSTFDSLGFPRDILTILYSILQHKDGLVLVSGSTGSGKTTTLYAALHHLLKKSKRSIISLEDPIEKLIPGVRQCAVNDIIDAGATDLLDFILKSPVAPSFRMRALNILWPKNLESINGLDLFSAIDLLVTDDPNNLENLGDYPTIMEDSYHIQELLNTDFRRSYLSLKILIKMDPDDIWMTLSKYIHKIKIDYGGLYFLMILFRSVSGWNEDALVEIKAITRSCLGSNWPEFMKFKPAAILTLMQLEPETAVGLVPKWLDESTTPFWASRYATLIALEKLMKNDKSFILHSSVLSNRNDTHRFVDAKIRDMELKFYI